MSYQIVPVIHGEIKNCLFVPYDTDKYRNRLLELNDKKVRLIFEDDKPKRRSSQNRLYWAYLNLIEKETGNYADDLHEIFKRKFLPPREVTVFDKVYRLPASTTELNTKTFSEYLEKICVETGIQIPSMEAIMNDYQ